MQKFKLFSLVVISILFTTHLLAMDQSVFALESPCIWANDKDKASLLKVIDERDWAAGHLDNMKENMAAHKDTRPHPWII